MRLGMFLNSSSDCCEVLSFCDKIVGLNLLRHVGPVILDRTHLGNVGPVR